MSIITITYLLIIILSFITQVPKEIRTAGYAASMRRWGRGGRRMIQRLSGAISMLLLAGRPASRPSIPISRPSPSSVRRVDPWDANGVDPRLRDHRRRLASLISFPPPPSPSHRLTSPASTHPLHIPHPSLHRPTRTIRPLWCFRKGSITRPCQRSDICLDRDVAFRSMSRGPVHYDSGRRYSRSCVDDDACRRGSPSESGGPYVPFPTTTTMMIEAKDLQRRHQRQRRSHQCCRATAICEGSKSAPQIPGTPPRCACRWCG